MLFGKLGRKVEKMTDNLINLFSTLVKHKGSVQVFGSQCPEGARVQMFETSAVVGKVGQCTEMRLTNEDLTQLLGGYIQTQKHKSMVFAARTAEDMQAKLDTWFLMHPSCEIVSVTQSESLLPQIGINPIEINPRSAFWSMTLTLVYIDNPIERKFNAAE